MHKLRILWRARVAILANLYPILKLLVGQLRNSTAVIELRDDGQPLYLRCDLVDLKVYLSCMAGEFDDITTDPADVSVVLDLGGFIGISARVLAAKFPQSQVFVVEPDPDNYSLLARDIAPFKQISAIQGAVCGAPQMLTFFKRTTGSWGTSIKDAGDAIKKQSFDVTGYDLNTLSEKMGFDRVDVLKMDIEGAEADVFAKPSAILSKTGTILVELHDYLDPYASETFFAFAKDRTNRQSGGEKVLSLMAE